MGTNTASLKARWAKPENREKASDRMKAFWADPVGRAKLLKGVMRASTPEAIAKRVSSLRARGKRREFWEANAGGAIETRSEYKRAWHLWEKYRISVNDYNAFLARQNGRCAFCARPPRTQALAVDHDHRTGKVRGLLCRPCNRALGMIEPSFDKVVEYLRGEVSVPS